MDPSRLFSAAKSGGASGIFDYVRQPLAVLRIVALVSYLITCLFRLVKLLEGSLEAYK